MRFCKTYLLLTLVALATSVISQNKIDSLLNALAKATKDTNRVNILVSLCKEKINTTPSDSLILGQLDEAMMISIDKKYTKGLAETWMVRGNYFFYNYNYTEAINMYQTASAEFVKAKNRSRQAQSFFNIGTCYLRLTKYDKALTNNLQSLKIYEELKDDIWVYRLLNNIGGIYYEQGNYKKTLEYFLKALDIVKRSNNKEKAASELNNIGQVYTMLNDYAKALDYFNQALAVNRQTNDDITLAEILGNMGSMYIKTNDLSKALDYLEQAKEINRKIDDKLNLANNLTNISEVYEKKNDVVNTIKYLEEALAIEQQTGDLQQLKLTYAQLEKTYLKNNKFDKAYEYLKKYSMLQDTLYNNESARQVADMETKYQTEKKEKENQLLNKQVEIGEIKSKQQKNYLVIAVLVLGLIVYAAFNLYRKNKLKQKANVQLAEKNRIIEEQKEEVDQAFEKLAEKNKEVLDSIHYAKRIQTALLTHESYIEKNLKKLKKED